MLRTLCSIKVARTVFLIALTSLTRASHAAPPNWQFRVFNFLEQIITLFIKELNRFFSLLTSYFVQTVLAGTHDSAFPACLQAVAIQLETACFTTRAPDILRIVRYDMRKKERSYCEQVWYPTGLHYILHPPLSWPREWVWFEGL